VDHQAFAQLLGSYGEFVGSFAVLATLIYVALQVRHSRDLLEENRRIALLEENRRIALSQVHQSRMDARMGIHKAATEEAISTILAKLNVVGPAEIEIEQIDLLDKSEKVKLAHWVQQNFLLIDNNYYQASLGLLDIDELTVPQQRRSTSRQFRALAEKLGVQITPRLQEYWNRENNTEA
jgi:hypothetical protein